MSGLFNMDAPLWVFMGEVADLLILSFLWWICCLGIVTVGASTTALYYVLGKKMRKEQTYVAKDFFKSFRQNFRQSVPLSFITIIGFTSLGLYIMLIIQGLIIPENAEFLKFIIPVTILFGFEFISFNSYLWAILARFETGSKALIKSSLVMLHKHLLTTLVNLVIVGLVGLLIYKCPVAIIMAPGLIIAGQSYLFQNIFRYYTEQA